VGASSSLPQKRNPFLLEHVQGRTAGALGAFVSASAAMRGVPYTSSIASGSEAMRPVWGGFSDIVDASVLIRMVLQGVRLNRRAMYKRAREGFTSAGMLANLLVEHQLPFREAQRWAGEIVAQAVETHATLEEAARIYLRRRGVVINLEALAPDEVCGALEYGGGPARSCTLESVRELGKRWGVYRDSLSRQTHRWRDAHSELAAAVAELCGEAPVNSNLATRVKPISIEPAWVERAAYAAARCQSSVNEA
jgi:argininosuccinate lyase